MADGQKVSDPELVKLEQHIVEKYDSIKDQVKRLQGTIDQLEAHWVGLGANAFGSKQAEINTSLVHMGKTLAKFLDAMNATRKIKNDSEDKIMADAKAIDPGLGNTTSALSSY
ncbi:WXG100 family type VII secretion target [Streptomyces sp. TS71-3]|jgi:uncharacterized protein YukE|uniref:WXG100 family type VII secretion target n=1 Tax=Streptomyces sp. TS71-3 TaxID=2733862 RepID=UPI001B29CEF7|nr:WXG100 family type VII secretion target [Streptomyces sp. TS71-3]GHJ36388.1 hypothetical protein Sm713_19970 [Streptomyces sp. TS71-3]